MTVDWRSQAADATPLVGVRPEVVAEAAHTFGNLFHRLHYCARKLQHNGVEEAAVLDTTITELEDFLRLVLDYASPLAVDLQRVSAAAVLGSIKVAIGEPIAASAPEVAECHLTVDAGRLSQAFQLMGTCLGRDDERSRQLVAGLDRDPADSSCWLTVQGKEAGRNGVASGPSLVAWALAQKLVEAHGGTLGIEPEGAGLRWRLRLPLPHDVT